MTPGPAQAEQAARTRAALLATARRLFTEQGFHGTGTEEIVACAGVTRGALYHHFGSKEGLFLAVFEAVEADLMAREAQRPAKGADAWDRLVTAFEFFLAASAADLEVQRVILIDGPAVLGWAQWKELEGRYGLGLITAAIAQAVEEGHLAPQAVTPLAHMLLAALDEAALLIANAESPEQAGAEAAQALRQLLDGLRRHP